MHQARISRARDLVKASFANDAFRESIVGAHRKGVRGEGDCVCASGCWGKIYDERPEYGEQKTPSGEERFNEERLLTPFDFASTDLYEAFLALLPSV